MNENIHPLMYQKLVELFRNKKYKEILDLFSYVIKIDRNNNKLNIFRYVTKEKIVFSLRARIWKLGNPNENKLIKSDIKFSSKENLNYLEVKKMLINDIYKRIIKNEIMMV